MDARVVAVFVFLFLSTGYSLKNVDEEDDDILDTLQETDNLKEAPEMREEQVEASLKNVDADDNILDMLQETDNLKEVPEVRKEQLKARSVPISDLPPIPVTVIVPSSSSKSPW